MSDVYVLDGLMGSGKSYGIFKWIQEHPNEKYIYVSPLLSEVEEGGRIHRDLKTVKFNSPSTDYNNTKSSHLLSLLKHGYNIACTHNLYLLMDEEHLNEIERQGYIVILDEEVNVIENFNNYSRADLKGLLDEGVIEVQECDGMLLWIKDSEYYADKHHKYHQFRNYVKSGMVYVAKRDHRMMVTQLPIKLFTSAKKVIIITYMFDGNVLDCFLRLKGIEVKPFTEVELKIIDKQTIRDNIKLVEPSGKFKKCSKFGLSSTWYSGDKEFAIDGKYKKCTLADLNLIANLIASVGRNNSATAQDMMYTLPKARSGLPDVQTQLRGIVKPKNYFMSEKPTRYNKGKYCWLSSHTRATNDYAHKWCVVHAYNRYPLTPVKSYLQDYGVGINDDVFALSELLQFVWRSRIRKGESIVLCIVSERMRELFVRWLND